MNKVTSDKRSSGDATRSAHDPHTEETWLPVPEWPYEVSSHGNVRRLGQRRNLTGGFGGTKRQYPTVTLGDRRRRWTVAKHRLVADAFLGPRPTGTEIHHKDHNPANPAAGNLEYVTSSQNKRHAVANGYHGVRRYNAKLTAELVREIRRMKRDGHKVKHIAETLKISESSIYHVVNGSNWKSIKD